jgi:hypothetical protein
VNGSLTESAFHYRPVNMSFGHVSAGKATIVYRSSDLVPQAWV